MSEQAERCTRRELDLHIDRQRNLGELMIGDHDKPRRIELVVSGWLFLVLVAVSAGYYFKWFSSMTCTGVFS